MLFLCLFFLSVYSGWHHHNWYGIYTSCDVLQTAKKVWAGQSDVETPIFPDSAELYSFDSDTMLWNWTCHEGHVAASRKGDVLTALQYDMTGKVVTLMVWKGVDTDKPTYTSVVPEILFMADLPAVAVSDDGKVIAVLGSNGKNSILHIYSPDNPKPTQTWRTKTGDSEFARHLDISATGEVVAFHRAMRTPLNKSIVGLVLYDTKTQKTRFEIGLDYSDNALGLSRDGNWLVFGFMDYNLYKWNDKDAYVKVLSGKLTDTYVQQCVVNDKGQFALGLNSYDAKNAFIHTYDKTQKLWEYSYKPSAQNQNAPMVMNIESSGRHFIVGTWGDGLGGKVTPNALVFDFKKDVPLYTGYVLDGVGSAFCANIALSGNVLEIVYGGKSVHANVMGRNGELYYDSLTLP